MLIDADLQGVVVRTSDSGVSFKPPGNTVKSKVEETRVEILARASGCYLRSSLENAQLRVKGGVKL